MPSGLDISLKKTLSQYNDKQKYYKMVFEIAVLGWIEFTKKSKGVVLICRLPQLLPSLYFQEKLDSDSLIVDLLSTPRPFSCGSPRFAACKKRC